MDKCSREYERAMDTQDIRNPEPSAEFCPHAAVLKMFALGASCKRCVSDLNLDSPTIITVYPFAN